MKVVILAGGLGTRLSEETVIKPKPMVEIGGKPILWHIMSIYGAYGHTEFLCALGYKAEIAKEYFLNFYALNNDISVDLASGKVQTYERTHSAWKVHLIDTGLQTQTGGRIKRLKRWLENEPFMLTYGDGLANVDIAKLVEFHKSHGKLATVTAVRPPSRFGAMVMNQNRVEQFLEKPQTGEGWINGGFFVLQPEVLDYIAADDTSWEKAPVEKLAAEGQLMGFQHTGFWQPMDTLREKNILEEHWASGHAPWKIWP